MGFLLENCIISPITQEIIDSCSKFDCGDEDLNSFFIDESIPYAEQLLGKTYCFRLDNQPEIIVCAFTVSNDSIRISLLPNSRGKKIKKDIPRAKHLEKYPAVLIGRLGISIDFKRKGVGTELMDFIKAWFVHPLNKTGCRFIVVDALNEAPALSYYEKNSFGYLFSSEEQEALSTNKSGELKTRLMHFDLMTIK